MLACPGKSAPDSLGGAFAKFEEERMSKRARKLASALSVVLAGTAHAEPVSIVNPSFEVDPNNFNEFFFGDPSGWESVDVGNVLDGGNDVQGTLTVASPFFTAGAPDGDNVAILFIGQDVGTTEVGLRQVLTESLAANTEYTLSVEVGNIASGEASNGTFFDLQGFPGYRIELLAGGVVLAEVSEGTDAPIAEGEFELREVKLTTGSAPLQLGQPLEIRLYNSNIVDPAFPEADLEVDFDNVRLDAVALPACFIELSQSSYVDGESVVASSWRLVGSVSDPTAVEWKSWLALSDAETVPIVNLGASGALVLPAGTDVDFGPVVLFTVTPGFPRGTYGFGCRLLDPVTGATRSLDENAFELQ
jgi:hypothetical protein